MTEKKEDLGLVVATKDEAMWMTVRDTLIIKIEDQEKELIINKEVLKLAKHKILLEQRK